MSGDEKRLRVVNQVTPETVDSEPVIRLETSARHPAGEAKQVPGGGRSAPDYRLDMPSKQEVELRTHQPSVEALIASEEVVHVGLEESWDESHKRRHPIPWGWFVLVGVLVVTAVGWSLLEIGKGEGEIQQVKKESVKLLDEEEEADREAAKLVDQIDGTIRKYFRCTSTDALMRLVRHPDRVRPMVEKYYRKRPVFTAQVSVVKSLVPVTLANRGNFWTAEAVLSNREKKQLMVEIDEAGEPKIDWESLVGYQPMPWTEFAETRPKCEPMDFRVEVAPDNLYTHEFTDPAKWACFMLTARDSDEFLFGYAPKGSALEDTIMRLVRFNSGKPVSLILRLSVPVGTQSPRGVVIEKVLSARWIYVVPPAPDDAPVSAPAGSAPR